MGTSLAVNRHWRMNKPPERMGFCQGQWYPRQRDPGYVVRSRDPSSPAGLYPHAVAAFVNRVMPPCCRLREEEEDDRLIILDSLSPVRLQSYMARGPTERSNKLHNLRNSLI